MKNLNKQIQQIFTLLSPSKSREFHWLTEITTFADFKQTPYNSWPEAWKKTYYKAYIRFPMVSLPKPTIFQTNNLIDLLRERRSVRQFIKQPMSLNSLSNILYYSAGINNKFSSSKSDKRFYPSAGARYPLEIYPIIMNCKGIQNGVYHYHLKTHSLELILKPPFLGITFKQFNQLWLKKAAVLLLVTAVFDRTEMKYKDRGYRHILTEYGHLAQNLYLTGTAEEMGVCSIGGFIENGLNKILDINGIDESVIGVVALGTPSP